MIALTCPHCKDIALFFVVDGASRRDAEVQVVEQDCKCELSNQDMADAEQRALDALLSGEQRV